MANNRVCAIHQEYCPDGACRWCDPPPAEPDWFSWAGPMAAFIPPVILHFHNCASLRSAGNACDCTRIATSHT